MGNGCNLENAVSNVGVVFKHVCVNVYVVIVLSLVFTQNQESVFLPCVAGTYSANSITSIAMLDVQNSRYVKFFKIGLINFSGDTTRKELYIYQVDVLNNSVRRSQIVAAENSVPSDVMKRYPRIYLVVLESANIIFGSSN